MEAVESMVITVADRFGNPTEAEKMSFPRLKFWYSAALRLYRQETGDDNK